jgi:hypothetical protein
MPDAHFLNERYQLIDVSDGVATLRNLTTGEEIKGRVIVDLNDGVLRFDRMRSEAP